VSYYYGRDLEAAPSKEVRHSKIESDWVVEVVVQLLISLVMTLSSLLLPLTRLNLRGAHMWTTAQL